MPGIQGRIDSVLARLGRLQVETGSIAGGGDEFKQQTVLFEWVSFARWRRSVLYSSHLRALEGIKDELQILSEQSNTVGYKESEADRQVISQLVEDLRDAVIEYQVSLGHPVAWRMHCLATIQFTQQKSLYEKNCRLIVCPDHA